MDAFNADGLMHEIRPEVIGLGDLHKVGQYVSQSTHIKPLKYSQATKRGLLPWLGQGIAIEQLDSRALSKNTPCFW
jgi:hypothetical protein